MDILPQLLVNALIAGSIYAVASAGLSLGYGLLRILNFAHGHLMMVGVYFFYFVSVQLQLSILASGIATLVFSILFAAVVLEIFILPFSRFSFLLAFVSTIALGNILEALVSMSFGVNVKSLSSGKFAESLQLGSIYITPIQILIISSTVVIMIALAWLIHSTSLGRKFRALAELDHAAESVGISKKKVSYVIFIIGTAFSAYAGILVGYETNMQPTMGSIYTIKAFAAMVLGGLGNIWGTIAGSYLLALVENLSIGLDFGDWSIPAGYKDAFSFIIILLVLLFRPEGLFRKKQRQI